MIDVNNGFELLGRVIVGWNQVEWAWCDLRAVLENVPSSAIDYAEDIKDVRRKVLTSATDQLSGSDDNLLKEIVTLADIIKDEIEMRHGGAHTKFLVSSAFTTLYIGKPPQRYRWDPDKDVCEQMVNIISRFETLCK